MLQPAPPRPTAPGGPDPYDLDETAIVEPPRSLGKAIRQIGPGLILAGSIVGTGELIATTKLGAEVGFTLLWLVIVSCFIKVFVQIELGRHAMSSGETTMMSFRRMPGPGAAIGWWWVGMMLITQLQLGAMVGGVGQAFHLAAPAVSPAIAGALGGWDLLVRRPELPWALAATVSTMLLLARGSYKMVEKGTTFLVVAFTLVTLLCVVLLPASGHPIPWDQVGNGLEFRLPWTAIGSALAMFGITGVGASELVAYPYWCIEKGYARRTGKRDASEDWLRRARGWMRVLRLDAWVSFCVYTVATLAFYFLGAAVLHAGTSRTLPGSVAAMLDVLSSMYRPVMGPTGAVVFIVIGVFAVLYSTLFASTGANARALADFLRVNGLVRFDRGRDRRGWIRLFCVIFPMLDFSLFILLGDAVTMVTIGGIAQALTLPMLGAAALYLRFRRTDPRLAPGRAWDLFLWLSLAGLSIAAGVGVWQGLRKFLS